MSPSDPTPAPLGDGMTALAVDRPDSIDALRHAVATRATEGTALYPQGGRVSLDHGGAPTRAGVAIDTTRLAAVIDYPAADMTITVEAGMTAAALAATLDANGQRLTLDVCHPDRATLGGLYATNSSGPRRFGAGRPRDQIIGVSFVTADGNVVKGGGRVVKNVAGYDFPKLLTGSMGSLGVIASLTLKVRPKPEASALVWMRFDSAEAVGRALDILNASITRPIAIDVLDRAASRAVGGPTGMPEAPFALVVGFEDNPSAVSWQVDRLPGELGLSADRVAAVRDNDSAPLWTALTEFQDAPLGPLSFVANLTPSAVAPFLGRLTERHAAQAHAGNGIVRVHVQGEPTLDEAKADVALLRGFAVEVGGNLILSRCPTSWKATLGVWGRPRGDWPLMAKIKAALDPAGLMNPGRFVGSM